jgi:type I restriction enzyme S subunit
MVNMGELFEYGRLWNPSMELVLLSNSEVDRFSLQKGDLIFARQSLVLEGTGKCSIIMDVPEITCFESHLIRVRLDKSKVEPLFYYYYFDSHQGKANIQSLVMQVAAAGIRGSELAFLNVPVPPLPTQRKIAAILSAYDDLIENNLRRIKILEEMAQNLYREWFVKFRFPGHQHARFTDSPLGPIPEGWEATTLQAVTTKIGSGATPRGGKEAYESEGIHLIRSLNVYDYNFEFANLAHISEQQATALNNVEIEENDILLNITGASVARCAMVPSFLLPARVNQHVAIVRTDTAKASPFYVLDAINSDQRKQQLLALAQGGATREALTKDTLNNFEIVLPSRPLMSNYDHITRDIHKQREFLQRQILYLRRTRDLLLPKLISGEVDVSDLDITIPEELDAPPESFQDETSPATVAVRGTQMNLLAQAAEESEAYEEEAPERRTAPVPVEEWDTDEVMAAFRQAARKTGISDRATLLKAVSAELRYERLGSRIKEVLQGRLRAAIRRKIIGTNGPEVWPETPTMDSYDRDTLIETLCSVMRKGTVYERDEVTRAVANHLGFRRLTDTVLAPIKSAINGAIRRGVLAYEGTMIWREQ